VAYSVGPEFKPQYCKQKKKKKRGTHIVNKHPQPPPLEPHQNRARIYSYSSKTNLKTKSEQKDTIVMRVVVQYCF
jgi:hypothetical protein